MQSTLETAISTITQAHVPIVGSGRTDAGAHAVHQVVAFSADTRLSVETLGHALNAHLPGDIALTSVREVDEDFNPRKDALSRTYRYLIWNRPVRSPFMRDRSAHVARHLNEATMHAAAQSLIGRHDFSSFIPARTQGSRERTVFSAQCCRDGDVVSVQLEATGFMRQMVRAIVGTLVRVGLGKLTPADFAKILHAQRRELGGDTVPAKGLYLLAVQYPEFTAGSTGASMFAPVHMQTGAAACTEPVHVARPSLATPSADTPPAAGRSLAAPSTDNPLVARHSLAAPRTPDSLEEKQ